MIIEIQHHQRLFLRSVFLESILPFYRPPNRHIPDLGHYQRAISLRSPELLEQLSSTILLSSLLLFGSNENNQEPKSDKTPNKMREHASKIGPRTHSNVASDDGDKRSSSPSGTTTTSAGAGGLVGNTSFFVAYSTAIRQIVYENMTYP